jgi:hypothetical protein
MNEPNITIADINERHNFPGGQPRVIIDPMIFRTTDAYLHGRRREEQSLL